jgi:hypothetical protein
MGFADAACDELGDLGSKVKNENFLVHGLAGQSAR